MLINLRKKMTNQKGFTLIELMVVIAIIGVLAAIAIPKFSESTASAKDAKLKADLRTLDSAIMMYYAQATAYPTTEGVKTELVPKYIAAWPKDAKDTDLSYTFTAATGTTASFYVLSGVSSAGGDAKRSPGSSGYVAW